MKTTELNGFLIILLMGLSIYIIRLAGYWIGGHLPLNRKVETWLNYLPGCIMISIVAPFVLTAGPLQYLAAAVAGAAMWITDSLLLAMILGISIIAIPKIFF